MSPHTSFKKSDTLLTWRVHLLRQNPRRLPALILAMFLAALGALTLFGALLPALAAILLLLGATGEYLFPITYRITRQGIYADSLSARMCMLWQDAKRCVQGSDGLLLTSLPTVSRLDNFRGVLLRYAPEGEPGDRASVLNAIAPYAPEEGLSPRYETENEL